MKYTLPSFWILCKLVDWLLCDDDDTKATSSVQSLIVTFSITLFLCNDLRQRIGCGRGTSCHLWCTCCRVWNDPSITLLNECSRVEWEIRDFRSIDRRILFNSSDDWRVKTTKVKIIRLWVSVTTTILCFWHSPIPIDTPHLLWAAGRNNNVVDATSLHSENW